MKGKVIIEAIQEEETAAVAEVEGWDTEKGMARGLKIDIGMSATRLDVVEICYALCAAFKLDRMEQLMLAMKLTGMMPGEKRKEISIPGPMNGRKSDPDSPPPRCFNDNWEGDI